ncbi:hypothetical protein ACP70R_033419 [Stipagrostis hirtigluma subsp. patula]
MRGVAAWMGRCRVRGAGCGRLGARRGAARRCGPPAARAAPGVQADEVTTRVRWLLSISPCLAPVCPHAAAPTRRLLLVMTGAAAAPAESEAEELLHGGAQEHGWPWGGVPLFVVLPWAKVLVQHCLTRGFSYIRCILQPWTKVCAVPV